MNWIKDFKKVIEKTSKLIAPLLQSHSVLEINEIIENWFNTEVKLLIYPEVEKRLRALHKEGYEIYFVTSTLSPIANNFQKYFGFGKVVATDLTEANGYYSSMPSGKPCHGQEKADRIIEIQKKDNLDLSQSFAFSDHISDLAMLNLVGYPVVVNPNPVLKVIALKNKWEIISPKLA